MPVPESQDLRRQVKEFAEAHDTATVDEVVSDLSRLEDVSETDVIDTIDEMEAHGFVYLIDRSDETEVCVP